MRRHLSGGQSKRWMGAVSNRSAAALNTSPSVCPSLHHHVERTLSGGRLLQVLPLPSCGRWRLVCTRCGEAREVSAVFHSSGGVVERFPFSAPRAAYCNKISRGVFLLKEERGRFPDPVGTATAGRSPQLLPVPSCGRRRVLSVRVCGKGGVSLFRRVIDCGVECSAASLNVTSLSYGGAVAGAYVADTGASVGRSPQVLPAPSWGRLPACLYVERRAGRRRCMM